MRENNRKPIEKCRRKLPQFTTMNVIDGQAGLVIYSSLIFYSLTIDNILNIIVLLILAGISIRMLTGQNGILNRASEAKDKNGTAQNGDLVKLSAMDALSQGLGTITDANLKTALNNNIGEGKYEITGDATNGWTVTVDGQDYRVEATGIVNGNGSSTGSGNWDKILEDANKNPESMKHKEQVKSSLIGIGTDGKPVNMDLWKPTEWSDGWSLMSIMSSYEQEAVYDGGIDDDGRIVGKMPQYIYSEEEGRFKEVIDLGYTFYGCTGLRIAPEIPGSVKYMDGTFDGCTGLTTAPEIPNSVTRMYWTFSGCTNLTGEITINANLNSSEGWYGCFSDTTKPIQLTGTCPILSELAETSENGNVTVK